LTYFDFSFGAGGIFSEGAKEKNLLMPAFF
jgi:hypothetical protein